MEAPPAETPPLVAFPGAAAAVGPDTAVSYGRAVGRGFSWLTMSLVGGRVFGVLAQLALGGILSRREFGLVAIAVPVATLVRVFQDGGVPQVLVQRGSREFSRLAGPAFWLSAAFGLTAGCFLAAASPAIAWAYGKPDLTPLLLIVAAALPFGAPASMFRARLRVDLRFQAIAMITLGWFAVRYFGSVGLALLGLGAASLVLPFLINVVIETVAGYLATGMKLWREPPRVREWPTLLKSSLWVVVAASGRGLTRTGDYLVLGVLVSEGVLGQYYFGYLVTTQVVELLAMNFQHVVFPVMSCLADEPERQSRAIMRTTRVLVLVAAPVSLGLAVSINPIVTFLDATIWNGKWSSTIPLMQILAVAAPIRMFSDVVNAALASRGRFRAGAALTIAEGLWLMLSAFAAVRLYGDSLTGIATVIAISQAVFSISTSMLLLRDFSIRPTSFLAACLPPWIAALAAAGASIVAVRAAGFESATLTSLAAGVPAFVATFVVLARLTLQQDLRDLVQILPAPIARVASLALALPPQRLHGRDASPPVRP